VDPDLFEPNAPGVLVPISGNDPRYGAWSHFAFSPYPLPSQSPGLSSATYRAVGNARAALAGLDSTARQLPNPRLLRPPTLRTEAQSTSALEGTYAPLSEVLIADEERPSSLDLREVLNYVAMADQAFGWIEEGRNLTIGMLEALQKTLVDRTPSEKYPSGVLREDQVVIGQRPNAAPDDSPVYAARFVPPPPGLDLRASLQDLLDWINSNHRDDIDPVVAAAMGHYQFETLHPFHDGNGRIGRLLIVIHLLMQQVVSEPTLTVSPWFEARRGDYYDHLLGVSTRGDWDGYVRYFASGLEASALQTRDQMLSLVAVQTELRDRVRNSRLRADTAHALVDYAVGHVSFTARAVERDLGISYGRANALIGQLTNLGILAAVSEDNYRRRFYAPDVLRALVRPPAHYR
jgi:Fic family protein